MSDDEKLKKDQNEKNVSENEEIIETTEVSESNEEISKTVVEETENVSEATNVDETKSAEVIESEPEVVSEPEPVVSEEKVVETQPTVESNTQNVEIPDQVVNNANNNNYSNYQNNNANNYANQTQTTTEPQKEKKGMAIFALILSILGFFTGWFVIGGFFAFISLILSIVILAKKKPGKGMAITALILSILTMFGAVIGAMIIIPILGVMGLGIFTFNETSKPISSFDPYNIVQEYESEYSNEIDDFFSTYNLFNTSSENTTSSDSKYTYGTNSTTTTNSTSSYTNTSLSNTTTNANKDIEGVYVGNYTVKYGTYNGEAAADGITLILNSDKTGKYNGRICSWSVGTHDFAQDSSSRGRIKECIIIKTTEGNYYFYPISSIRLTDGDINDFVYQGK